MLDERDLLSFAKRNSLRRQMLEGGKYNPKTLGLAACMDVDALMQELLRMTAILRDVREGSSSVN